MTPEQEKAILDQMPPDERARFEALQIAPGLRRAMLLVWVDAQKRPPLAPRKPSERWKTTPRRETVDYDKRFP